ncbi:methyl-accepting chemotaxis protein [Clostridium gelidum]|uniref:Methyl-accepting chemotaxis protein n=1 Tax=Clostridium gelidum TaxID=704125 RepID=A0ABN6J464_9CLOT|nr:methyl-accepting chemotaxis protein [Clostridium gelidum]BCZ48701.1 methyl-accepting chemotaxis protein [Clostridium gelidum]
MSKFLKISRTKTDKNINDKKKVNILFKTERIIRGLKIKNRLIISYGLLVLIPLLIIGITSVFQSKNAMNNKISNYSSQIMSQIGVNISTEMSNNSNFVQTLMSDSQIQDYLESIKTTNSFFDSSKVNTLSKLINTKGSTRNDILSLGIIDTNNIKIGIFSNQFSDDIKKNLSDLSKNAEGKFIWKLQKTPLGSYSLYMSAEVSSLTNFGKNLGFAFEELNPKILVSSFKNVNLGTNSSIFIVDSNGIIIASEDENLIGTDYKDANVVGKILDTEKDLASVNDEVKLQKRCFSTSNGESLVSYAPLNGSDWYVVGVIPYSYLNSDSNILRNNTLAVGLISFIIAMTVALIISRSISNPLEKLVVLMKKAKEGNLDLHIVDESKDEISEVISAFNDMVGKINTLIVDVKSLAENVSSNTKIITDVSEHSYASSEEIAATMSEITQGASEQATSASEGLDYMNKLSQEINMVNGKTQNVSLVLEKTKEMKQDAIISVETLNSKAEETNKASAKIVEDVNNLNSNVKDIKAIVELIVDIAEQTNLLSLNAAIEAARAGESGRGFAVVADEVRKLADKSKESSIQINKIINDIQHKTEVVVKEATSSSIIIREQMKAVEKTDTAFKTIFEGMDQIDSQLKEMVTSINEIVNSKDKTKMAMESISAISEETAATTEQVSDATQEQINGSQKVAEFAQELNEVVENLNSAISQFKVN